MIPLNVRVGDRHITKRLDDLTYSKSVHGAAECGFKLAQPITDEFPAFERVFVYDGTSADTVWDGRLEDPGRSVDDDGERWDMSAIGEASRSSDRTAPLMYITRDLSVFEESRFDAPSASCSATEIPGHTGVEGVLCQFSPGQPIDRRSTAAMKYLLPDGNELAGFGYTWDSGFTGSSHQAQAVVSSPQTVVRADQFSTSGGSQVAQVGFAAFPEGVTLLTLRNQHLTGATTVRTDDNWAAFYNLFVRGLLRTATGVRMLGVGSGAAAEEDYREGYVYAHEVVADLLGRGLLPTYDGATAQIDTSGTYQIDQLNYADGVSPAKAFEDLMGFEPDFHHWVGPYDPVTGKSPFAWRRWPTPVRYEISTAEGLSLPGAEAERYNRVTVRWLDKKSNVVISVYSSVVDELEHAGPGGTRLTREPEDPIDLSDEAGSQSNADQRAATFLAEHATPPVSGAINVTRPVWDLYEGCEVSPAAIEPGYLVRGRELADMAQDLGITARDGRSVFRLVNMTYTASEASASLELDAPPRTDSNELAKQMSRRNRKR